MPNPVVVERKTKELDGRIITRHYYWCPGCDTLHSVSIRPDVQDNGAGWYFSGTLMCPTYEPSQLSTYTYRDSVGDRHKRICHTYIRQGQIQFLNDCTHTLNGKTVPLPPLPDWFMKEEEEERSKDQN